MKKILGNFKVMAAIAAVVIFMMILYGYNRSERRKLAKGIPQQQPMMTVGQKTAMQAISPYKHPNLGAKKGGCGCGKK